MEELVELRHVLRSLVVSSPTQVDARSLLRDFRDMMGKPLPHAKYGYRDPVLFLRERFADCFLFQGDGNPVLTLIVPKHLKHIDEHVQRQKVSSNHKHKGKRRSIQETRPSYSDGRTNLIADTFKKWSSNIQSNTKYSDINRNSNVNINGNVSKTMSIKEDIPQKSVTQSNTNISAEKCRVTKQSDASSEKNSNTSEKVEGEKVLEWLGHLRVKSGSGGDRRGSYDSGGAGDTRDRRGSRDSGGDTRDRRGSRDSGGDTRDRRGSRDTGSEARDSRASGDSGQGASGDHDEKTSGIGSEKTFSDKTKSTNNSILEKLQEEVTALVLESPKGVWLSDLMKLYRERYGRALAVSAMGAGGVVSLVWRLRGVRLSQPAAGGDWLLSAPGARRDAPLPLPRARRPAPAAPADTDDALPGIDFDPEVFPSDCMHYLESIAPAPLEEWGAGALMPVLVGEVYSPSHLWLLRLGEGHYAAMDRVMDEMAEYYCRGEGAHRTLAAGAVRVGHYCAALYDGEWHRAVIVRLLDHQSVMVRHVDYGTVSTCSPSSLRPLLRRWGALRAQAVRARLAGVRPPRLAPRWPDAAPTALLAAVRDKRFVADVVARDLDEGVVEVVLVDTSGAEDVCVGAELVRAGVAEERTDSALQSAESHLFPRFEALESGAAPSLAEIHSYRRNGIVLECVADYRRHVPPACLRRLPPRSPTPPSLSSLSPPSSPTPPSPPPSPPPAREMKPWRSLAPSSPLPDEDGREMKPRRSSIPEAGSPIAATAREMKPWRSLAPSSPLPDEDAREMKPRRSSTPEACSPSAAIAREMKPWTAPPSPPTSVSPVQGMEPWRDLDALPSLPALEMKPWHVSSSSFLPPPARIQAKEPPKPAPSAPAPVAREVKPSRDPASAAPARDPWRGPAPPPPAPRRPMLPAPPRSPLYPPHPPGMPLLPYAPVFYPVFPPAPGEVRLSSAECDIYRHLSRVDPAAAHWFMERAMSRGAARQPPPGYPPGPMSPGFPPGPMSPGFPPGPMSPGFPPAQLSPGFPPGQLSPGFQPPPRFSSAPQSPSFAPTQPSLGFRPAPPPPGFGSP